MFRKLWCLMDFNPGFGILMILFVFYLFQPCSYGDNSSFVIKEQTFSSLKRNCCSDTNISFVPQKRPSKRLLSPEQTDIKGYKKTKKKRKKLKKSSKDIYKVEVVNTDFSSSKNFKIHMDKPPVIIRIKRVKCSKRKISISKTESYLSSNDSVDDNDILSIDTLDKRNIRVVRKPSTTYEPKRLSSSKSFSQNHIYSFEHPELTGYISKNFGFYHPTNLFVPNTRPSMEYIQEKIFQLDERNTKCTLSFEESIKILSNLEPNKIGQWFYNVPNKIQDDLSFDSYVLNPITDL